MVNTCKTISKNFGNLTFEIDISSINNGVIISDIMLDEMFFMSHKEFKKLIKWYLKNMSKY